MQKSMITFTCVSLWLIGTAHAARPEERAEAAVLAATTPKEAKEVSGMIEMVSSGHMLSKKAQAPDLGGERDPLAGATLDTQAEASAKEKVETPEPGIEEKANMDEYAIAKQEKYNGALRKMEGMYTQMKTYFNDAASKVWENGKPEDQRPENNKIANTGLRWKKETDKFRNTAAELRKHAEVVYEDIVKSHQIAAKKQMRAFKEEMAKLKPVHEAHDKIKENADAQAKKGDLEAFAVEKKYSDHSPTGGLTATFRDTTGGPTAEVGQRP